MKTTDVYVEQVLLGLLVLLTAALFVGWVPDFHGNAKDIVVSIQILGTAYLLGILYDRFADTLLQHLEQHGRLAVAIKRIEANAGIELHGDPFPEDRLRFAIMEKGQGLAKYADYLRSRIRLSRAMAVTLPALSVAFTAFLMRKSNRGVSPLFWQVTSATYALVFLLNLLGWPKKPPKTNDPKFSKYRQDKPPKNKPENDKPENDNSKIGERVRRYLIRYLGWHMGMAVQDPAVLGAVFLLGFLQWEVSGVRDSYIRLLPLAGLIATLFAGWVWYRISSTFLELLRAQADKEESAPERAKALAAATRGGSPSHSP